MPSHVRLTPNQPSRAAIPAARKAILLCRSLVEKRDNFIVESTLAGHGAISLLAAAKRVEYRIVLIYVALGDPDLQIDRVRLRVAQGGHDIPDADIRRRYFRSLSQAPAVGREAIAAVARSFMVAFPDLRVVMDDLLGEAGAPEYHWTLSGTNSGPGGTGRKVLISGFEEWRLGSDGLIAASLGHFDAAEYQRQLV